MTKKLKALLICICCIITILVIIPLSAIYNTPIVYAQDSVSSENEIITVEEIESFIYDIEIGLNNENTNITAQLDSQIAYYENELLVANEEEKSTIEAKLNVLEDAYLIMPSYINYLSQDDTSLLNNEIFEYPCHVSNNCTCDVARSGITKIYRVIYNETEKSITLILK